MFTANEIRKDLWLGDLQAVLYDSHSFLRERKITHVLSMESECPEIRIEGIHHKYVDIDDQADADLLSLLRDCFQFIDEGLTNDGRVLVHCFMGVSRSSSVVIAYLMNKEKIPFENALAMVKEKHSFARPNDGFTEQLKLFEAMGCELDPANPLMKQHKLEYLAQDMISVRYTLERDGSLIRRDVDKIPVDMIANDPDQGGTQESEAIFKCKKCRRSLFQSNNLLTHEPGQGQSSFKWYKQSRLTDGFNATESAIQSCTSYFTEPVAWMEKLLIGHKEGKIQCPKCNARLGCFDWAGQQCSCGAWITPALQIHKNKVDQHVLPGRSVPR